MATIIHLRKLDNLSIPKRPRLSLRDVINGPIDWSPEPEIPCMQWRPPWELVHLFQCQKCHSGQCWTRKTYVWTGKGNKNMIWKTVWSKNTHQIWFETFYVTDSMFWTGPLACLSLFSVIFWNLSLPNLVSQIKRLIVEG